MDELLKLEHLSLVSKICTELDNHLGMNDKDLAEFIIDLAEANTTFDSFKKALIENGAEFPDSFITNLLRIIQLMKTSKNTKMTEDEFKAKINGDKLAAKFPGLAMPNRPQEEMTPPKDDKGKIKKEKMKASVADDMMAELEAFAPSVDGESKKPHGDGEAKKVEKRERSKERSRERSRERKSRRDRSKERSKDEKSTRRSRSRDKRHRSRERRRSRSRSKDKRRSRSRDRKARSK